MLVATNSLLFDSSGAYLYELRLLEPSNDSNATYITTQTEARCFHIYRTRWTASLLCACSECKTTLNGDSIKCRIFTAVCCDSFSSCFKPHTASHFETFICGLETYYEQVCCVLFWIANKMNQSLAKITQSLFFVKWYVWYLKIWSEVFSHWIYRKTFL